MKKIIAAEQSIWLQCPLNTESFVFYVVTICGHQRVSRPCVVVSLVLNTSPGDQLPPPITMYLSEPFGLKHALNWTCLMWEMLSLQMDDSEPVFV